MSATNDLPDGSVQFFDAAPPPLEATSYRLTVTHTIADDAGQPVGPDVIAHQAFIVDAPRFALGSTDIYALYPPANARGDFVRALPHVVLSRPALPWERLLETDGQRQSVKDTYQPPWVAVLLFDAADTGADGGWKARSVPISQVVSPEAGVLGPALGTLPDYQQGATCMALDVPASLFASIAPARDELAYLAHVRQVDTGDKETTGDGEDGGYSVVVGNRLPNPTGTNTAHLVSVEGLGDYLPGGAKAGSLTGYSTVRLISLASWTFTCEEPAQSFRELMINLAAGASSLKLTDEQTSTTTSAERLVSDALARGYVPLDHTLLDGEHTVSWYRGPLVPINVERQFSQSPYLTADGAKTFDPATGLFDVSYAVAWQMGRLLALADATFATALMNWRRRGYEVVDLLNERLDLFDEYRPLATGRLLNLAQPGTVRKLFARGALRALAARAAPGGDTPIVKTADPTGLARHGGSVPGLLTRDQLAEIATSGADPVARIRELLFERR